MIEFIIPLNLPVRAVEVSAPTKGPSESLINEMTRWVTYNQKTHAAGHVLPNPHLRSPAAESSSSHERHTIPAEIEQELESLRAQRSLFTGAIAELRSATKLVEKQLDGMLHEFQEATVELAQAIAAKLIFEEIESNRFPIANLVHEVVSRLDTNANALVRLHPDDLALVYEHPAIGVSSNENSLRFVADVTLARGDCKAKAGEISVIYELRRQIEEIRRQLLSTVSGHAEA